METVRIGADGEKEVGDVDGVKVDAEKVRKGLNCCEKDVKLCYGETVCEVSA